MDSIVEILPPTIEKPEVSIDWLNNPDEKDEHKAGATSPLIQMADHYWKEEQILSFELSYGANQFLPQAEFKIRDKMDILSNDIANDIETVDIFLRSDNVDFLPIKTKFLVKHYEQSRDGSYTFECELFVKNVDTKLTRSYDGTSFNIIKDVAKELGLGFASNIQSTNDEQKWLRVKQSSLEFFRELKNSSWVDENSVINVWVDPYYVVNVFNIYDTYIIEKPSFDLIGETNLSKNYSQEKENPIREFYISDHYSKVGTSNYLEGYRVIDRRGAIEKDLGYERLISVQDVDKSTYYEYLMQHSVDQTTLDRSGGSTRSSYLGFISENTHRNHNHAAVQNSVNDVIYKSKGLRFKQNLINSVMYVGIRVPLLIINDSMNNADAKGSEGKSLLNESLTQEYIVYEISYKYRKRTMVVEYESLVIR